MKPKVKQLASRAVAALVTNSTTASITTNQFQRFTWNLSTKLVRNDTLEGKSFVVVPMVMLVEGVHNGSNGPLFYPEEELQKTPETWNCKPVVVYHPEKGSACTPEVLNTRKIGVIMNAKYDKKKKRLVAEAWMEEAMVKKVDNRVWNAIEEHEPLELSTGVYTDNELTEGEWEGEKYIAIARNYRADHLAVLPDQTGACSLADGAGFIRNQLNVEFTQITPDDAEIIRNEVHLALSKLKKRGGAISKLLTNEASHETLRALLSTALIEKYPSNKNDYCMGPWIEAVYDDFFVYCYDGKLFKMSYSATDAAVKLEGEPSEVVRVIEYRTSTGTFVGNKTATTKSKDKPRMNKEQMVAELIANHGYGDADRVALMGLADEVLGKMIAAGTAVANKAKGSKTETPAAPAANAAPVTPTAAPKIEQVLNADQVAALHYGQRMLTENKAKLIGIITANKANKFTAETLNAMSIESLEGLAALAASGAPAPSAPAHDFSGLAPAAPISNAAANAEGAALVAPGMDFTTKE